MDRLRDKLCDKLQFTGHNSFEVTHFLVGVASCTQMVCGGEITIRLVDGREIVVEPGDWLEREV